MRVRLQNGEVCFLRDSGERVVSADSVATCSATWSCYMELQQGCLDVCCDDLWCGNIKWPES